MNAHDIIDSYVADVVRRLPRRQRLDTGAELRSLLIDELADRREGHPDRTDEALVLELLRGYGRPAEVATRYRPPLVLIDPEDTRTVVRLGAAGVAVVWVLGAIAVARDSTGFLDAARAWWFTAGLPAFAWPGLLLALSAIAVRVRQRWPRRSPWKPRTPRERREEINRFAYVALITLAVAGAASIIKPIWLLGLFFSGPVPQPVVQAFAYDQSFVDKRAPWLIALGVLQAVLYVTLVVRGRWEPLTRRVEIALTIATCAVIAWVVAAGDIFQARPTDETMKGAMVLIVLFTLGGLALRLVRDRRRLALSREHRLS
jgi:hypothetical protein